MDDPLNMNGISNIDELYPIIDHRHCKTYRRDDLYVCQNYLSMSGQIEFKAINMKTGKVIYQAYEFHGNEVDCFIDENNNFVINVQYELYIDRAPNIFRASHGICYSQTKKVSNDLTQLTQNIDLEKDLGLYVEINNMYYVSEVMSNTYPTYRDVLKYSVPREK